jgi:glucose/arabinose dehydrogenase
MSNVVRATMAVALAGAVLAPVPVDRAVAAPLTGRAAASVVTLPRTVPSGFVQTTVANVAAPTAIEVLPDGRMVVLEQGGRVRITRRAGVLRPRSALTLPNICSGGERGLLGFTHDPTFATNGFVYVYYTRRAPSFPNGCVNRVSRFVMVRNRIDPSTEKVLLDKISAAGGNHNAGDIEFGKDGYLYVATGDAGTDPRGNSGAGGENDAAIDRSLLNGKILRITRTGRPAPTNPYLGANTVRCARRGNTAATPTTRCQEIFAYGLRNPFRFAFDPNASGTRFFINDVGQGTFEEVNVGARGANYGWNAREGVCPQGQTPPCAGPPAGVTDPIVAYGRSQGQYITAGAFVPVGSWPSQYDGGYLFADGGSGRVWLRTASGTLDLDTPFATDLFSIADMVFRTEDGELVLYVTRTSGEIVRIRHTG